MRNLITREHGYWRIKDDLKYLLRECRAKQATRYSIDSIGVFKNTLVATDGKRLLRISINHKIWFSSRIQ